ncbi:MAG: single-stranded DNA-binding protein [Bacteroidetes bacterium]|jgi:single-strand DNA-binding protein|nr:single-stranded DNA-binding protein [Bacteroidota bacterium]
MVNRVTLIGNLGKDVEIKELDSGSLVGRVSIATHENYKDRHGEWQEKTEWHEVVFWEVLARRAAKQLKKGDLVFAEGKLPHRTYTDSDERKRWISEVRVSYFRFLERSIEKLSEEKDSVIDHGGDKIHD